MTTTRLFSSLSFQVAMGWLLVSGAVGRAEPVGPVEQQELLDARGSLVTALRDRYVASYNLLFSVGKLTAGHLGLDLSVPEASNYYASVRERNFGYDRTDDTVWTTSYRP